MLSKTSIFNLALNELLLQRRVINADSDTSNEAVVLRTNWDVALFSTLEDLDLDSTSEDFQLELVAENPNDNWLYAYKYPQNCAYFRRIKSLLKQDNRSSFISKKVAMYEGSKVIFTNEYQAVAEIIPTDIDLSSLGAMTGLAIARRLATLSVPLVVGKGSNDLMKTIEAKYVIAKGEAQEKDRNENFDFPDPEIDSEFVEARKS